MRFSKNRPGFGQISFFLKQILVRCRLDTNGFGGPAGAIERRCDWRPGLIMAKPFASVGA